MNKVTLDKIDQIINSYDFLDKLTENVFDHLLSYLKDQEARIKELEDKKNEEA